MKYYAIDAAQSRARLAKDALSDMLVDPSAHPETEDMSNWLFGSREHVGVAIRKEFPLKIVTC